MKFYICLLILLSYFGSGNDSLEADAKSNAAYFEILKTAYNARNFEVIYSLFTKSLQDQMTYQQFSDAMTPIWDKIGQIQFWVYSTTNHENPVYLVSFNSHLHTGTITWTYHLQKLASFVINDGGSPSLLQFLLENQDKAALTLVQDNKILIDWNGDRIQPICSVLKIPIAIEFIRQSTDTEIDVNTMIPLDDVNKFYVMEFDSHKDWLAMCENKGKIIDNKVSLQDIAEGMIIYSSNANTEFLQTYLTLAKIDKTIAKIQLTQSKSAYLVSTLLSFQNFDNSPYDDYIQHINSMSETSFNNLQLGIHQQLLDQTEQAQLWKLNAHKQLIDPNVLAATLHMLTKSTTNQYAQLMYQLSIGSYFSSKFYQDFYKLIGIVPMSNPAQALAFTHVGVKGGSSAAQHDIECVLALAAFALLRQPYPALNVAHSFSFQHLTYETDYIRLIQQYNAFSAMINLNGHFNLELAKRLQQGPINE